MGKIFYSMAGEGRGHATRARTIIEDLRDQHQITVYAPDQAYDLLEPLYRNTEITVRQIGGLGWSYTKKKKLNYVKSFFNAFEYFMEVPGLLDRLEREIEAEQPDLIITDFDPALPRAAKRTGIPFISFDHQHFLTCYDLSGLPAHLRFRANFMAPAVNLFYWGQKDTIVSSFYFPPLKKGHEHVKQIGVLLSKEVSSARTEERGHLVVYLRRFTHPGVIDALKSAGMPVKIYGLGARPKDGNLTYHEVNLHGFIEDLATSRALISTAGNQVVGEALYLGKPVLAMPEPGNFEQEINGFFIENGGTGLSVDMDLLSPEMIRHFLNMGDFYRSNIDRELLYGNGDAMRIINHHIGETGHRFNRLIPVHDEGRAVS